jgi:translation initiation factor IF-2
LQETPVRRLLPILLSSALLGVVAGPAWAQNVCSPSTAPSTVRYPQYPGSTPYSNSTINITSNCSGPTVEVPITPDPYANVGFPVPGFQYAPTTVTASAMPSVDPSALYAPTGPTASYGGYPAPGPMSYGAGYSYGAAGMVPGAAPFYGGLGAPWMSAYGGYPGYGSYGAASPYPGGYGYPTAGYGYPGYTPYGGGYGYPGYAPYGAGYGYAPGGYPGYGPGGYGY